jgi:glyoxylase-like metal-dependent hydrolase (beta-lactamase superfamily II)
VSPAIQLFYYALLLLVVASFTSHAQPAASPHFQIEQLAPGVYAAIATDDGSAGSNAGIVDLGDKTIVFDTFLSLNAARDLLRAAEQLTHNPVAYVINSHFHNDHIRGNQVFSPNVEIISTAKTREAISRIEPEQIKWEIQNIPQLILDTQESLGDESDPFKKHDLAMLLAYYKATNESRSQLKTRLPSLTFESEITLQGTRRIVKLLAIGGGHTPGDCIMLLPDEHIAFVGDLVAIGMHPYIPDGSPDEWQTTLEEMEKLPIGTIVPGHGAVGHRTEMTLMSDYIQTLRQIAEKMVLSGKKENEIPREPIPSQFQTYFHMQNFVDNLRFFYGKAESNKGRR